MLVAQPPTPPHVHPSCEEYQQLTACQSSFYRRDVRADGQLSGVQVLIATAITGTVQALVGGQPLLIIGVAEPIVLIYSFMYSFAKGTLCCCKRRQSHVQHIDNLPVPTRLARLHCYHHGASIAAGQLALWELHPGLLKCQRLVFQSNTHFCDANDAGQGQLGARLFLPWAAWVCIWTAAMILVLSCVNVCHYVSRCVP